MWGNVFSERPEAVKCSNFPGGHFVFLKCCEFCTEAVEMPGVNTFSGGRAPKTTGFCTVIGASLSEPHMGSKSVPRELSIYLCTYISMYAYVFP